MVIAHLHSEGRCPPFTVKMGKNSLFWVIFTIKTAGGVHIPQGISRSTRDSDTLKVEIETPDLTEYQRNFILSKISVFKIYILRFKS